MKSRLGHIRLMDGVNQQTPFTNIMAVGGMVVNGCSNDSNLDEKMLEQRLLRTQARAETLRSLGHAVFEIFECEWNTKRRFDDHVKTYFYQKQSPHFFLGMTTSDIIALVKNDSIFAAIECDISVQDTWPRGDITPYDYFSEMSPIFKTCNVSMDLIGDHMQKFMLDNGISNCDRRTLIGGMKAEKILLATPLLKWYIEHGMVVSDVHTVIEFTPKQCFKKFVDNVAFDRREADAGRKPKLQADTSKLIGNSAYGSMLLDPTKHRNIRYAQDLKKFSKQVNQPTFRHFDILDEEFFEIEHAKRQTVLNMPIQLGFFVLQYAKLRMLQFYYDCVDQFLDRSDFQYSFMDTDSAYMALSAHNFESLVRSSKLSEYNLIKNSCLDIDYVPSLEKPYIMFPRICCEEHIKHDTRTPGLFKV